MKQTKILTHATNVNGWIPAVYMSCMSQNFRLFHVSNLSVRNFRIFLLMYPGSLTLSSHRIVPGAEKHSSRTSRQPTRTNLAFHVLTSALFFEINTATGTHHFRSFLCREQTHRAAGVVCADFGWFTPVLVSDHRERPLHETARPV